MVAILLPVEVLVALIYVAATSRGPGPEACELCTFVLFAAPLGAGFGYLAGGLTAGVFLILEGLAKWRQERQEHEEPERVEEQAVEEAEESVRNPSRRIASRTFGAAIQPPARKVVERGKPAPSRTCRERRTTLRSSATL